MTAKDKTYHHGNLAAELVRIACETLETAGPNSLSLRGVAEKAGVSATAVYRHFAHKEALLAAVAGYGYHRLVEQFQQAIRPDTLSSWDQLRALGRAYIDFAAQHPYLHGLMFGPGMSGANTPDELKQVGNQAFAILQQAATRCLPPHTSEQQVIQSSLALWSLVHGYAILARDGHFAAIPADLMLQPDDMLRSLVQFSAT